MCSGKLLKMLTKYFGVLVLSSIAFGLVSLPRIHALVFRLGLGKS